MAGAWFDWIYRALVLLVVACPCALVISTPVSIVSGLAAAARKGILIKGGAYLEEGRRLATLALDKTGTITHGKPVQTDFVAWRGDAARVQALAASLAARSEHPVSGASPRRPAATAWRCCRSPPWRPFPGAGCAGASATSSTSWATTG